MDLSTRYLGRRLDHPFMAGASPLADDLDAVRRLEDGGAAAIVLRSLFEEQITVTQSGRIHNMEGFEPEFRAVLEPFPKAGEFVLSPDAYLEHLRRASAAVRIPIIASLNGVTSESWLDIAPSLEEAGAAAVELNSYAMMTDPDASSMAIEASMLKLVHDVTSALRVPVAVKLSPYFTALGSMARRVLDAGADGLVLFNRFYQTDIDVETVSRVHHVSLSSSSELPVRLRWVAILRGRTDASLAVGGGVATPEDGIKAILAGADAVQLVSAILRHGPEHFRAMRDGLGRWLESKGIASVDSARGRLSVPAEADAGTMERGDYLRLLQARPPNQVVPGRRP